MKRLVRQVRHPKQTLERRKHWLPAEILVRRKTGTLAGGQGRQHGHCSESILAGWKTSLLAARRLVHSLKRPPARALILAQQCSLARPLVRERRRPPERFLDQKRHLPERRLVRLLLPME